MAKSDTPVKRKAGKSQNIIIQTLDIRSINRTNQDIDDWRNAMKAAENVYNPQRNLLYDLYFDIQLDAHLINCTDARRRRITNANFVYMKDGNEVEAVQDLIDSPVFFDMLEDLLDARFWGFTLLDFYAVENTLKYNLIPRKHVKPERHVITHTPYDMTGIDYTEPPYKHYILTAGKPADLGIYLSAAQYVLYKRGDFADWAQFCEIFGMPYRWAEYDGNDPAERGKINNALDTMGSAAYGIFPSGTKINIEQNNNNGNGETYEKLKNACDEQISLRMLGQTMTSKDGSSKSQAEVHFKVAEEVHIDDRKFILNTLNDPEGFQRILETFGYPSDGYFEIKDDNKLTLQERIMIDRNLKSMGVPISHDYFYETYGIEKPENYDELVEEQKVKAEEEAKKKAQAEEEAKKVEKAKVEALLRHNYNPAQETTIWNKIRDFIPFAANKSGLGKKEFTALQDEARRIAEMIYKDTLPDGFIVSETMVEIIAEHLRKAVAAGYGDMAKFAADSIDAETIKALQENIYKFSAAKNYQQLKDMSKLLVDSDGNRLSFSAFKNEVDKLNIEYNQNWLRTEYDTAQATSQMKSKWNQFQEEAENVPMLMWRTVGDERVRSSHAALDGIVKPADDPFWVKYWPPLDYNCRCDVIQTTKTDATEVNDDILPGIPKAFQTSPAENIIFSEKNHPYFSGVPDEVLKTP